MTEYTPPTKQHETVKPIHSVPYTFTINAANKFQYFNHPLRMRMALIHLLDALESSFKGLADYRLIVEISKPEESQTDPRIHLHGLVYFHENGYATFLVDKWNQLANHHSFKLSAVADMEKWEKYCNKDQSIMVPYLQSLKLPTIIRPKTQITPANVVQTSGCFKKTIQLTW